MIDWDYVTDCLWFVIALTLGVGAGVALGLTVFFLIAPGIRS